ncbi:hypothetical protein TraAM80_08540 [Trypanosoma rangeli]|uniref:Uncharacterized protein n=1 Tax=Trypanosoma rangeli TaxID=5698 RepID=A0A3R7LK93_TRYRA|nr:uncharacterized protein TraAM80_08540 [Trypanosoma rangeli]RNE98902.1 hypothetical protein TraAM80_08540 [Trypanosoma rangeli]|eukprot:RNE98902.1 hypothetical protein TraAM80_08540 [Trypanosoma rangeli]
MIPPRSNSSVMRALRESGVSWPLTAPLGEHGFLPRPHPSEGAAAAAADAGEAPHVNCVTVSMVICATRPQGSASVAVVSKENVARRAPPAASQMASARNCLLRAGTCVHAFRRSVTQHTLGRRFPVRLVSQHIICLSHLIARFTASGGAGTTPRAGGTKQHVAAAPHGRIASLSSMKPCVAHVTIPPYEQVREVRFVWVPQEAPAWQRGQL